MGLTRRQCLAALAAAVPLQAQRQAMGPKLRASPALCLFSEQLSKIGYDELGGFLKMMGFDGCELSVQEGGHIPPEGDVDLHLERAIEAITGLGLDVPVLSTTLTSPMAKALQTIFGWGGQMGIPVFRPGEWKYGSNIDAGLSQMQLDVSNLARFGQAMQMSIAIHNGAGDTVGSSIWDTSLVLRGLEPRVGYDFDVGYAAANCGIPGWQTALRMALPRLKMVTARDCYWNKTGDGWKLAECPLGEGMVDWPWFFKTLAQARFFGPIVLRLGYGPQEELAAIKKDLAFLRQLRKAAYGE